MFWDIITRLSKCQAPSAVVCVEQLYNSDHPRDTRSGRELDRVVQWAFQGQEPPSLRCRSFLPGGFLPPPDDGDGLELLPWRRIPGTTWWTCDEIDATHPNYWSEWHGGSSGLLLYQGILAVEMYRKVLFDPRTRSAALPRTLIAATKGREHVPAIVLPSPFSWSCDEESVLYFDGDGETGWWTDAVSWHTGHRPEADLVADDSVVLHITEALSDAVECGALGRFDPRTGMATMWIGQILPLRFGTLKWKYHSYIFDALRDAWLAACCCSFP